MRACSAAYHPCAACTGHFVQLPLSLSRFWASRTITRHQVLLRLSRYLILLSYMNDKKTVFRRGAAGEEPNATAVELAATTW